LKRMMVECFVYCLKNCDYKTPTSVLLKKTNLPRVQQEMALLNPFLSLQYS
jgi:hypothetical protein